MIDLKKWSHGDKFHHHVVSESLLPGKLLYSPFASLLSFAVSGKIQDTVQLSVTEKSLIDAKSDANTDKITLELGTFEEFSIAVLSGHDFCAPRGFVTMRSLFWIFSNQWYKKWNEKSHFYRHLVIIVVFGCYYYCLFNLQVLYVFVLEPKPFNLTKPRPRSVPMPEKVSTRQLSIKALIKELHFNLYLFRGGWW